MEGLKLHDAVVFLAAAGLLIPLAKQFRISPVLGFLLIGLAVGPFGLARIVEDYAWIRFLLITDVEGVAALAELGVVFLLFMIGLELSLERLWAMRRLVFGMGSAQIVLTALVIGSIAWVFGNSVKASVLLGACLALSSTAVVTQLLIEQGRFGSTVGRGSFAVLLAQDIAIVPILFLVGVFGSNTESSVASELGLALGEAFLAILSILGIGRLVVQPLFRFVGRTGTPELFTAVTLLIIISTAAATHAAGLSAALGAFLAGLLLAESEYRYEIEMNINPFKGLLLGLFFMSVGMSIDLLEILADPLWIALSILGLFLIKALITTGLARCFRFAWGHAVEMGLLLGQGGEFAFLIVGMALGFGILPDFTAQFMLIVVGATMFLTPLMARMANKIGSAMESDKNSSTPESLDVAADLTDHVLIVGYGRTGQLLATLLDHQKVAHIALDLDVERVAKLRARGKPVRLGDASRAAMLTRMRFEHAAVLAICTDDPGATEKIILAARRLGPDIPIVARARDNASARGLLEIGATSVVPELLESGLQFGHLMFEQLGLPATVARDLIDAQRTQMELALPPDIP